MSAPDVLNKARNGGTDAGRRFRLPPALRVPAVLLAVAVMAVLPRIMNLYWIDVFVSIGLGVMLSRMPHVEYPGLSENDIKREGEHHPQA